MKVELNGTKLSAEIKGRNDMIYPESCISAAEKASEDVLKYCSCFIFAVISFIISICLIPAGAWLKACSELVLELFEISLSRYDIFAYLIFAALAIVSIVFLVLSFLAFARSRKNSIDIFGFIIALVSFVTLVVALFVNIIFVLRIV